MSGHHHLLAKDPTRLGWKCEAAGCLFFKPAEEFDGILLLPEPDATESRRPRMAGGDFRDAA